MSFEIWLAFILANAVVTLIPGPSVLLVVGQALTRGTKSGLLCIVGGLIGDACLMALSLIGVGAILAASATLFQLLKWAGVFYMAYLGFSQIVEARRGAMLNFVQENEVLATRTLNAGFFSSLLNPKGIAFYVALLSQFIDPNSDLSLQISILLVTSTIVTGSILSGYVFVAARARNMFKSQKAQRRFGYTGGSCMIGGSVLIATTR